MRFQDVRLSKHFVLMDFMQDRDLYHRATPIDIESIVPDDEIEMGRSLCENLLEPMIELFGPCSIAAGYCPEGIGHYSSSPHSWKKSTGAGVDVCFHDWVNMEQAPIKLVEELLKYDVPFERLITYAGSEYICTSWSERARSAIYENVRVLGEKPVCIQHSRHKGEMARHTKKFSRRPDWRRLPNEPVFHTRKQLRPQHVRLGRYFSMLDFAKSEIGLRDGITWVPPVTASRVGYYGRMFAEVLEPVVATLGRVSIVQGMAPTKIAAVIPDGLLYRWDDGNAAIQFLLPQGVTDTQVFSLLEQNTHVLDATSEDHPSDTVMIIAKIEPFEPKTIYSGGFPYGYFSGEKPTYLPQRVRAKLKDNRGS